MLTEIYRVVVYQTGRFDMLITGISTVSEKGQLVIPSQVRKALGVKRGDRLNWTVDDSGEIRISLAKTDLMALQGRIKSGGRSVSVAEMNEVITDAATESHA